MKLQDAKPCLNCEEIYVGPVCPKCATPHCVFVTNWIQSLENNDNAKMLRNIIYGREEVHNAVRRFHVEREGESREIVAFSIVFYRIGCKAWTPYCPMNRIFKDALRSASMKFPQLHL